MTSRPLAPEIRKRLQEGAVIPALPLALDAAGKFDERRQRALCRYYLDAGAGGLAVGVHTTQFAIRDPQIALLRPVLAVAAEEVRRAGKEQMFIKVAGVCGPTEQAVQEAQLAAELGYDLVLLSMGGLDAYTEEELLERARLVGEIMPIFGFYLQPSVGGRILSYRFWEQFVQIPQVQAVKIAPFDRYLTLDVVRAVCFSGRAEDLALYTGNDDNIVVDLLTTYEFKVGGETVRKRIVGGLLGHWAVWTKRAVELLERVKEERERGTVSGELLTLAAEITEANAAIFDAANRFAGCIPGIHEVLRRQGLLETTLCLDPQEVLSPGQGEEIDRIYQQYPHLTDDDFVRANLARWLS